MFPIPLAGALLVFAQQAPQQPQFRATTELVEVDVRVVDQHGRFVATLTPDDFQLAEDGVSRPIEALYLVTGDGARLVTSQLAATPAVSAERPSASRQTWIFVFDTTHLSPAGFSRTRDAVRKFFREKFREGDLAGIVDERGMANNRLTSSRDELDRAAESMAAPKGRRTLARDLREWPRLRDEHEALQIAADDREVLKMAFMRACDEEPELCKRGGDVEAILMAKARAAAQDIAASSLKAMNMLRALTRGLARIPGPKTVVFLSEGFVTERMESAVQNVVAEAAAAGARIYTVDARGLGRGSTAEIMDVRGPESVVGTLGAGRDLHSDGMQSLAVDTGGFAIRNENNYGRALELIERDSGTYYVLGYRPVVTSYDGKYRRIEVRVTQPNLKVRARRGYLALEPARLLTPVPTPVPASAVPPAAPPDALAPIPLIRRPAMTPDEVVQRVAALAARSSAIQSTGGNAAAGWSAYERGDVVTAASELGAAAARGDAPVWVHYALGFAELAQGRPERAVPAWEHVRSVVPQFEDAYFDLADAYLRMHDPSSALAVLRQAERRWPADAEVYNAIGVVLISRGALDEAVSTFEKAVKTAPQDSLGYFNLGRAYSMRFFRSQRYSPTQTTWVANRRDRDLAVAQFEKCMALGGPYSQQARDALEALAWK